MAINQDQSNGSEDLEDEGTIELFTYGQKDLEVGRPKRPLIIILPVAIFSVITCFIIILTVFFYAQSRNIIIDKEVEDLRHSERLISILISQFYENIKKSTVVLGDLKEVKDYLASGDFYSSSDVVEKFEIQLLNQSYFNNITIFDNKDKAILQVSKKNHDLGEKTISSSHNVDALDLDKKIFRYNYGDIYYSNIEKSNDSDELVLKAYIRLPDMAKDRKYALVADVNISLFLKRSIISKEIDVAFYLMNGRGEYLINPGFLSLLSSDNITKDLPEFAPVVNNNIASFEVKPNFVKSINQPGYYSSLNLSHHGAEYPIRMLLLYSDIKHVEELSKLRKQFLLIGLSLAFVSLLLVGFLTRYFLSPLRKMEAVIGSYEKTGTIDGLPTESEDEIGVLSRSFYNLFKNKEQKEIELSQTRRYIDAITNVAPVLLSYIDKYQIYQFANHRYEIWSGKPLDNIVGSSIKSLLDKQSYEEIEPYINRALKGEVVQYKSHISYGGQQARHVKLTYTPEKDTCNNVLGFYVCVEDITQNTLSTLKIQELSQRLDFALEAPGIGVWDYDLQSGELIWDERMYDIYCILPKDFSKEYASWSKYLHPDDISRVETNFSSAIERRHDFIEEFRVILDSGELRWVAAHGRVICDDHDRPVRVIGTNMDITNKKELEIEKDKALVKAEDLVKLKSEFLASMSHEIRTPMNGVLGMLGLLKNTRLNKQQTHYTNLANTSAQSLLSLINDILDFSKVEAGKMELEVVDFNLHNMLGDFVEAIAHRAQEKGLEVILDIVGVDETFVKGDSGRLRQIFNNLVGNAIKFTSQGEILIKVELDKNHNDEWILKSSICDTGIGIPESKIDTLFDSFSQVDASTTRKYGGTGLGLAIVKKLCTLMGGNVEVSSAPEQGSSFYFTVLLESSDKSFILAPTVDICNTPILLVDDNHTNTRVMAAQLRKWGAIVVEADSGQSALNILDSRHDFATAIIDSDMPDMSGQALAEKMRLLPSCDDTHLILMTSLSSQSDASYFANIGFSAYFPKPTTVNDLFTALEVLISGRPVIQKVARVEQAIASVLTEAKTQTVERDAEDTTDHLQAEALNILLVEDNLVNQEVALGILTTLGFTADIANNGLEALEKLNAAESSNSYDIVLMDCQMPEMDGYEATRAIRSGKAPDPCVPIIAMTANAMKGDKEKCLAIGMDDYLSKPIDPQLLFKTINTWVSTCKVNTAPKCSLMVASKGKTLDSAIEAPAVTSTNTETKHSPQSEPLYLQESATMSEANDEVWNRDDFMNRIMNNDTIAQKLVELFKTDTPKTIKQLESAVTTGHVQEAGLLAHKLKGSVSNLGGIELASLAQKIELAGKNENLDEVESLWPQVRPQYDRLLHQIEERL